MVTGSLLNAIGLALVPIFVPEMKYMYPMEINFVTDVKMNERINFWSQTVAYIEAASVYYIFSLIFFICNMNLLNELSFIAQLCDRIGENEEKSINVSISSDKTHVLSHDVLQTILLDSAENEPEARDSKNLLRIITKYHANALM